jgi:hypothetical protein
MIRSRASILRPWSVVVALACAVVAAALIPNERASAQIQGYGGNASAAEQRALLRAVCQGEVRGDTCSPCPDYAGEDAGLGVTVGPFHMGSFVTPKAREAYVQLFGCDAKPNGFVGSVLLRRAGVNSPWKVVRYDAGVSTSACLPYAYQTGTRLLVCVQGGGVSQGYVTESVAAIYTGPKSTTARPILVVQDSTATCQPMWGSVSLSDWHDSYLDTDRQRDLELVVTERRGRKDDSCEEDTTAAGPNVTHRLWYRFDGVRFTVMAASRRTHQCLLDEATGTGPSRGTRYCPVVS